MDVEKTLRLAIALTMTAVRTQFFDIEELERRMVLLGAVVPNTLEYYIEFLKGYTPLGR